MLALKNAPTAQAGLIAYLWPLLIVLLSMLGQPLGCWTLPVIGGGLGLVGAALLVFDPAEAGFALNMPRATASRWSARCCGRATPS